MYIECRILMTNFQLGSLLCINFCANLCFHVNLDCCLACCNIELANCYF